MRKFESVRVGLPKGWKTHRLDIHPGSGPIDPGIYWVVKGNDRAYQTVTTDRHSFKDSRELITEFANRPGIMDNGTSG